jgi:hypothetical protein
VTICVRSATAARRQPGVSTMGWQIMTVLKANGVERGTRSYTDVVRLVLGTELGARALPPVSSSDPSGLHR